MINDYKELDREQIRNTLKMSNSRAQDVIVNKGDFPVGNQSIGLSHNIDVVGLGTVIIGASKFFPRLRNRVTVRMDTSKNLVDLHDILALTRMDAALRPSSISDIERLKIGHLYRVFFPEEATPLEQSEDFFHLPINRLKETIIKKTPEMANVLTTYLNKMEKRPF